MQPSITFTPLDLRTWDRGEVFHYFSRIAPTGWSLTVEWDVTRLRAVLKDAGLRFFPAYLWLVTKTLSEQTAFTLAEVDGRLGTYSSLTPLYAVFHEDSHTFSLLWTDYDDDFRTFHAAYLRDRAQYGDRHGLLAKPGQVPPPNAYTVSCVPWVGFRHFAVHAYDGAKPYYLPSVEAGRIEERDGRAVLPLSLTCHHAATDGWHVHQALTRLQERADGFARYL